MLRDAKANYYEHVNKVEPSLVATFVQRPPSINDSFKYFPGCFEVILLQQNIFTTVTSNQQPNGHFCRTQPLILPLIAVRNDK